MGDLTLEAVERADRRRWLATVILLIAYSVVFGLYLHQGQTHTEKNTELIQNQRYESCLNGIAVVQKFNERQQATAAIVRKHSEFYPPSLREDLAKAAEESVIDIKPDACAQLRPDGYRPNPTTPKVVPSP